MASISGDLIKINGTALPFINSYKIQRAKLWKDADRNMNGDVRATMIGLFPKLVIKFRHTTQVEMSQLCAILDTGFFNVTYYDPRTAATYTAQYYASDYDVEMLYKHRAYYKEFEVSLVPITRRTY